jgi:hypothetical protein
MNVLKTALLTSLILLPAWERIQATDSQVVENGYGIVRGPGYAFTLKAPVGWVIDAVSGVGQGLPAVFYPKGASWSESPAVAYARARPKTKGVSTIEEAVQSSVDALRSKGNPGYNAKFLKTIKTGDGKEGAVYRCVGSKTGDIEATVYFMEKRTIDFMTLSCRSEKVFESALPSFEQLAASYQFQPDKIPVEPNKQGFFQDGSPKD